MDTRRRSVPTAGEIARRFGISTRRSDYISRPREDQPGAPAGNRRVFRNATNACVAGKQRRTQEAGK